MNKKITINTIGWASDICDYFMDKLEEQTGKEYTMISPDDGETTVFTDEGQDIFNDLYDKVRGYIEEELEVGDDHDAEVDIYLETRPEIHKADRRPVTYENVMCKAVGLIASCNACDAIIFEGDKYYEGGYCEECAKEVKRTDGKPLEIIPTIK